MVVLTGCGPVSRYVTRQPYTHMPEYALTGKSLYFATTCGECSAGCGLIIKTMEGRAHKADGNSSHPVNHGGTCTRGQATLQGLYNPDRIQNPGKQAQRGSGKYDAISWEEALGVVKDALQNTPANQIGFLLGLFPDHLYDLVQAISTALGGANVAHYGTLGEFEARATLAKAAQKLYGLSKIPTFDLERTEMLFSFGANFVETWLSPVSYAYKYGLMRQGYTGQRGYLVQFESRMSQTAANADEWYPIAPGSELILAQALGRLVAEAKTGSAPASFKDVDIREAAKACGVPENDLQRLARLFANSPRPLAIPGGPACGTSNGQAAAEAILALNLLAGNQGKEGGISFAAEVPVPVFASAGSGSLAEVSRLIDQMKNGTLKVLFIHGANPLYDLPQAIGFAEALKSVPRVISFASFPDETSLQADYVLPDHTPLESWGYQRVYIGSDRPVLSGLQPVVVPLYQTQATADVLLSAAQAIGGSLAAAVPYTDIVDFLQQAISPLAGEGGLYTAPTPQAFWTLWLQQGGWWPEKVQTGVPGTTFSFDAPLSGTGAQFAGDASTYPYYLLAFPSPNLGDGSAANRPVVQESPDPMTTVMWNSWVEINTQTGAKLGVKNGDLVKVSTPSGEIECSVYLYPGIHPEVIAIPLGQGHSAFGRYAGGRGANPLTIIPGDQNEAGNLAFMATRANLTLTGKTRSLARYESEEGIYNSQSLFSGRP